MSDPALSRDSLENAGTSKIRVLMADDHTLVRQAIAEMLERDGSIQVVGQAADGASAVRLVQVLQPDVVLLDVEMPHMAVVEVLGAVLDKCPAARVIILTVFDEPALMHKLIARGAYAYLIKSISGGDLVAAVKSVASTDDRVILSLSRRALSESDCVRGQCNLSARELEVLLFAARGMSNVEIGHCLYVTEGTIKRHLHNVYSKMGVKSRSEATRVAVERNWITVPDIIGRLRGDGEGS